MKVTAGNWLIWLAALCTQRLVYNSPPSWEPARP
jgi:hypothetical protein